MKIRDSILSIIVTTVFLVSCLVSYTIFADTVDSSTDIAKLKQLGILDSSVTNPNSPFTREQMAKAIITTKGLTDEAATLSGSTIFPDVASNSELSGYVNVLMNRGIMFGMPDGYFHAKNAVTYSEACVTLVKLLGYGDSDVTGVWPNNYISKATDLKLTDKIKLKKNDKITVGTAAVMLNRLLDTNVKKANVSEADKTFSEALGLYSDIIVYDNSSTYASLPTNTLLTDKGTLYVEDSEFKPEIGKGYRVAIDDNNIKKVFATIRETKSVTVDSIIENTINYTEDDAPSSMVLPSNVEYYYHGVKQSYDKLSGIIRTNTSIIFAYNDNKTGYAYAVIVDPVYSKPQIAVNFKPTSDKIGDITLDSSTKIIKNGQVIQKTGIEDMDVVYSVTDAAGNNRCIFVYNSKVEGAVKVFSPNGPAPTTVQLDNTSYGISKDMDLSVVSKTKIGSLVSALLGYDNKIVAIKPIEYKTSADVQIKILGNSKTIVDLNDNQVLTDQGKYYLQEGITTLEVGGKYTVNLNGDTIIKVKKQENSIENYGVRSVVYNTITYVAGEEQKILEVPKLSTYYYKGEKIGYETVVAKLKLSASLILAKNGNYYEYGIIIDPVYSKPIIKGYETRDAIEALTNAGPTLFVYRDGEYYPSINYASSGDVVYEVTDLWGQNRYILALNTKKFDVVKQILPNKITPDSLVTFNGTYSFSKYFDIKKLSFVPYNQPTLVYITLDIDGKVIDIVPYY